MKPSIRKTKAMTYQGSKEKLAPIIVPFLESFRIQHPLYIEPFLGSASIFEKMKGPKFGSDINASLIMLWRQLIEDTFIEPSSISKEQYKELMASEEPSALQAYAGFFWSFSGMWNKGWSPDFYARSSSFAKACERAKRIRQSEEPYRLGRGSYDAVVPDSTRGALIYCDIPYKGTTTYKGAPEFNYEKFYAWCHKMAGQGNRIIVSEYDMPAEEGFLCALEMDFSTSMSTVHRPNQKKEKLFTLRPE